MRFFAKITIFPFTTLRCSYIIKWHSFYQGIIAMLKKIFSPRNIILLFLIAAFLVIIASQQPVLNEKRQQFAAAKADSQELVSRSEDLNVKKQLIHSESVEEEIARKNGYFYPDEYRIDYEED